MSKESETLYIPDLIDKKQAWELMKSTAFPIFIPNKIQKQIEEILKESNNEARS